MTTPRATTAGTGLWIAVLLALTLPTLSLASGANADADRDGDNIPDSIEDQPWYQAEGGSPDRKDVWLECDYMRKIRPDPKARKQIVAHLEAAFDGAPVDDHLAVPGVALHLTFDRPFRFEQEWPDSDIGTDLWETMAAQRAGSLDGRPFTGAAAETMRPYFYYCALVNSISERGTLGIAMDSRSPDGGILGNMFIIAVAGVGDGLEFWNTVAGHVGTLMHELGHSLGLSHGGADPNRHTNYKPNHLSVMNYDHTLGFLTDEPGLSRLESWDYSFFEAPELNERRLDEAAGVSGPQSLVDRRILNFIHCSPIHVEFVGFNEPADFDCNGEIDGALVKADVTNDGVYQKLGSTLEWDHLVLGGTAGTEGLARAPLDPLTELDRETAHRIERPIIEARARGHR